MLLQVVEVSVVGGKAIVMIVVLYLRTGALQETWITLGMTSDRVNYIR